MVLAMGLYLGSAFASVGSEQEPVPLLAPGPPASPVGCVLSSPGLSVSGNSSC